jgi:hypothetical protein
VNLPRPLFLYAAIKSCHSERSENFTKVKVSRSRRPHTRVSYDEPVEAFSPRSAYELGMWAICNIIMHVAVQFLSVR